MGKHIFKGLQHCLEYTHNDNVSSFHRGKFLGVQQAPLRSEDVHRPVGAVVDGEGGVGHNHFQHGISGGNRGGEGAVDRRCHLRAGTGKVYPYLAAFYSDLGFDHQRFVVDTIVVRHTFPVIHPVGNFF